MAIDHLVYGAPELGAAVDDLERRLGVRAAPGGKHPGAGTHNALLSLGDDCYLEIIAPDPEQEPPTDRSMPFGIDKLIEPCLVTWALRVANVQAAVDRARRMDYDPGDPRPMSRSTPDGQTLAWTLTRAPKTVGDGLVPFLINWGETPHPARSAPGGCQLVRLRAEHHEAPTVMDALLALDTMDMTVIPGPVPVLVALLETPKGQLELR